MLKDKKYKNSFVGKIFELGRGRVINQKEIDENPGIYPVYSSQSSNNGEMGKISTFDFNGEYITWTTDGAYAGTVFYRKGKFNCTNVCGTLKAIDSENIDVKYFSYLLSQHTKRYVSYVGNPKLMNGIVYNIPLKYIAKKEIQSYISDIISTCDSVIEKTEETIEKYKRIKAGMMQDLFTRGLDKNGKLRPKYQNAPELYKYSEELGRYIPKDWEVKPLECIASILSGRDYKNNPIGSCNVPIYGTGGIIGYTTIPLYNGPAVLTGRKGSINTPYYVENDFWNVDTIFCLKMLDDNYAKWFYYQIYLTDMMKYNEATGVPSTTSKTLNKILFSVPKSNEQKNIANYISNIDSKIEIEQKYLFKYKQIKQGLMKKLLTPPADAEIVEE